MNAYQNISTLPDNPLRDEFLGEDKEYRYAYAEDFLNTYIATQIKVLRDQRRMTQEELANAIGTKQSGISRLENVNYSNWKTETLKKVARALDVRLKITFETFGSLLAEDASFSRESLKREKFEDDLAFQPMPVPERDFAELAAELLNMIFKPDTSQEDEGQSFLKDMKKYVDRSNRPTAHEDPLIRAASGR